MKRTKMARVEEVKELKKISSDLKSIIVRFNSLIEDDDVDNKYKEDYRDIMHQVANVVSSDEGECGLNALIDLIVSRGVTIVCDDCWTKFVSTHCPTCGRDREGIIANENNKRILKEKMKEAVAYHLEIDVNDIKGLDIKPCIDKNSRILKVEFDEGIISFKAHNINNSFAIIGNSLEEISKKAYFSGDKDTLNITIK